MGGRFVLGFGNSLAQMSSPMLLTEICHPQHRGPLTAVYNCLWNLGSLSKYRIFPKIASSLTIFSRFRCRLGHCFHQWSLVVAIHYLHPGCPLHHPALWYLVGP